MCSFSNFSDYPKSQLGVQPLAREIGLENIITFNVWRRKNRFITRNDCVVGSSGLVSREVNKGSVQCRDSFWLIQFRVRESYYEQKSYTRKLFLHWNRTIPTWTHSKAEVYLGTNILRYIIIHYKLNWYYRVTNWHYCD